MSKKLFPFLGNSNDKNKNIDIDSKLKKFNNHVEDLIKESKNLQTLNNVNHKKKLEKIKKSVESLYKYFFDKKNFNDELFESVIGKKFIKSLSDYITFNIIELSEILFPIIMKILFHNKDNLNSIGLNDEFLLMNTQIINCVKIMIKSFIELIKKDKTCLFIEEQVINFVYYLMDVLTYYPNFYFAISASTNQDANYTVSFDSNLFELIISLFSIEHSFKKRENKTIIRKSLLKCLNLENFYTVNISLIEKLLDTLVNNLIAYYESFVLFNIDKFLQTEKTLPKNATQEDIPKILSDDTISYLLFFSMITHCFSIGDLKDYLSNILFNTFFCKYIQRDIISLSNEISKKSKSHRILEFIYFITKYVNNYEICEILFYFLFGFNYYDLNEEMKQIKNNEEDENLIKDFMGDIDKDELKEILNSGPFKKEKEEEEHEVLTSHRLHSQINKILKPNIGTFSSNVNLNIEKGNHNFESIIAFFSTILEDHDIKSIAFLMNILCNISKNVSYVFMTEMIIPYYLHYLCNHYPKEYDLLCDNMKVSRYKIDIIEILKTIHPKYFSINSKEWMSYFEKNLELNYLRNINMINRLENSSLNLINNNNTLNPITDSLFGRMDLSLNFNNSITDMSITTRRFNDDFIVESPYTGNNSLNYLFNNYTVTMRIKFFELIIQNFKKFTSNKYVENLYYSQFFLEISSLPYSIDKGEKGDKFYNIYSDVTFAGKKHKSLFSTSIVGLLYKIRKDIDKKINSNFTTEEIDKLTNFKNIEDTNDVDPRTINKKLNKDFFKNIVLYNEIFKEFLSNIFTKAYIDQVKFWTVKQREDENV